MVTSSSIEKDMISSYIADPQLHTLGLDMLKSAALCI